MNTAAARTAHSIDDYLLNEAQASQRHEYVAGGVFAMAGGSERHNRVSLNIAMRMRLQTRGSRCGVFIADMKLRLDAQGAVYYPDVMLCCDEADDHPLFKTSPCIVVEVLSPSTAATDRREKRAAYLALPSLQAYVLADAERRAVAVLLRQAAGFVERTLEEDQPLLLPCGTRTITLALDDVYEDVEGLARAA